MKWAVGAQLCDESKNVFLFTGKILQAVRQLYNIPSQEGFLLRVRQYG